MARMAYGIDDDDDGLDEPYDGFFTDIWTARSVPPVWVIKDLLPAGLGILAAPPKTLKSTLTYVFMALVNGYSTSALPPSMSVVEEKGNVMVFSYEASAGEIRFAMEEGLKLQGKPDGSMLIADDPWKWRIDEEGSIEQMLQWLDRRRPRLVVLDPLRNFHALDEKDSAIVRLLEPFRRWAVQNDATFLIVHHTRKPNEDQRAFTTNDVRGTSALFGMVDYALVLTPIDPDKGRVLCVATFKRAQGWEKELQLNVWANATVVLSDAEKLVHKVLLKTGALTAEELNAKMKLGKRLREILVRLDELSMVRKVGKKWQAVRTSDEG